ALTAATRVLKSGLPEATSTMVPASAAAVGEASAEVAAGLGLDSELDSLLLQPTRASDATAKPAAAILMFIAPPRAWWDVHRGVLPERRFWMQRFWSVIGT